MDGKGVCENYVIEDGWWHYSNGTFADYNVEHAVIKEARFGKLCGYDDVLVGLSLIFKSEDGHCCNWTFESMKDIQILFNKTLSTYLNNLIGQPMLLATYDSNRIMGCKVNTALVVPGKSR